MNSQEWFDRARKRIPGGVNSPVRAFGSVGMTPRFIERAKGDRIWDVEGNEYIDFIGSWGPMILGHAHPVVLEAVERAAREGLSFGAATAREVEMAELICAMVPSVEMVRMVNSGTEATMSALRVARGFTGRDKIIKFQGCYHGHADSLLVSAGSGAATFGQPDSPGVPAATAADTITLPYNDSKSFNRIMDGFGNDIAAVIVEPVAGNMGLVLPEESFLQDLRSQTQAHGAILIFDEVMCGFRTALHGAQAYYGITPDMTCLGKIIGGGLPAAAYGGKAYLMDCVSPAGPIYQAGTLSGNPLAMTAGIETLRIITEDPSYTVRVTAHTTTLTEGLRQKAAEAGVAVCVHQSGSMFSLFFTDKDVKNFADSSAADQDAFAVYFQSMLEQGIYLPPSQFETCFVSGAHTDDDIRRTIEAAGTAFAAVASYRQSR